jgi:hypothetical protein
VASIGQQIPRHFDTVVIGCLDRTAPLGKVDHYIGRLSQLGLEAHHGFGARSADCGEEDANGGYWEGYAFGLGC